MINKKLLFILTSVIITGCATTKDVSSTYADLNMNQSEEKDIIKSVNEAAQVNSWEKKLKQGEPTNCSNNGSGLVCHY